MNETLNRREFISLSPPLKRRNPNMATNGNIVSIRNLSKLYAQGEIQVTALDNISLDIAAGEFLTLMGPSGSGKSTLLHILAGIDRPTSGEMSCAGHRCHQAERIAVGGLAESKCRLRFPDVQFDCRC